MENFEVIDKKMMEAVKNQVFPGATYTIIYKNQVHMGVVGNRAILPNAEVNTIDTIYDLASLTKVISTNTIIAKLLEDGKVSLDDKVNKYLPQFKYDDVTIYHLLTHSSGLPKDMDWHSLKNRDEIIDRVFSLNKVYETGTKAVYSDTSFMLLGFIIETILGKSLDICAKEMVFEPLSLTDTGYLPTDIERCAPTELQDNVYTKGVVHDEKTKLLGGVAGLAGVFSTIGDMTKFITMVLNNGIYNNHRYLKKETIDLWFKKEKQTEVNSWRSIGWICGPHEAFGKHISDDSVFHGGYTGGRILIDRQNRLAIVFLSNRVHPTRENTKVVEFTKELFNLMYDTYVKEKVES